MLVLAGDETGLAAFEAAVSPVRGRFPMRLANHAAFHTPLQAPFAEAGRECLGLDLFGPPSLPLVDGRGAIWWPEATDIGVLRDYTLGRQVTELRFHPRGACRCKGIRTRFFHHRGPGLTLGGAVAQSLILDGWRGMRSKAGFRYAASRPPRCWYPWEWTSSVRQRRERQ